MKKFIALLIVLPLLLSAGALIKSQKEGESIEFWTKETAGSYSKKAEITDDGILKVAEIQNLAGDEPPLGAVPVGTILPFAGATPPTGYLLCNGQGLDSVANPQYAKLYSVIGTTYGGTSASSFAIPDFTTDNKFPRAAGGSVALGTEQNDATAVNGLESAHDHASKTLSVGCTAGQSGHTHSYSHTHSFAYRTPAGLSFSGNDARYMLISASTSGVGVATPNQGASGSTTSTTDPAISCSASGSVNLPTITSLMMGDIETRPYSIAINYIIKY